MTELAVQSAAAFLAIFGFSIILDVPKKFLLYAGRPEGMLVCLPAGASGGTLPDYGGLSFQSGGINPEPYFCKGLKSSGYGISGSRDPAHCAGSLRLPLCLFYDTGAGGSFHLPPGTDHTDSRSDGACHIYCGFIVPPGTEDLDSRFGGR